MKRILALVLFLFTTASYARPVTQALKVCYAELGGCAYFAQDENYNNALYLETPLYNQTGGDTKAAFEAAGYTVNLATSAEIVAMDKHAVVRHTTLREDAEAVQQLDEDRNTGFGYCALGVASCIGSVASGPVVWWAVGLACGGGILSCNEFRIKQARWVKKEQELKERRAREEAAEADKPVTPESGPFDATPTDAPAGFAIGSDFWEPLREGHVTGWDCPENIPDCPKTIEP